MTDERILDAFQMMWGPFPEPVMLVHKDRTVLAVNSMAAAIGIPQGIKCFNLNPEVQPGENHCRQCKANEALRRNEAVCEKSENGGHTVIGYWIPLKETPDVYVHFGVGTAEMLQQKNTAAPASGTVQIAEAN